MSQGKPFTPEERETIIKSLQPYLEMGFSRNKACSFIGLKPQTLSVWVKEDESLLMRLVAWENVNSALALANVKKAIENEGMKADQGDTRMENSWKLLSKLEDGYKDKLDVTTGGEKLPTPILGYVPTDNSSTEDQESQEED